MKNGSDMEPRETGNNKEPILSVRNRAPVLRIAAADRHIPSTMKKGHPKG